MKFAYKKIDIQGFERIWDSGHYDQMIDSNFNLFKNTAEEEWKPTWKKWLVVM